MTRIPFNYTQVILNAGGWLLGRTIFRCAILQAEGASGLPSSTPTKACKLNASSLRLVISSSTLGATSVLRCRCLVIHNLCISCQVHCLFLLLYLLPCGLLIRTHFIALLIRSNLTSAFDVLTLTLLTTESAQPLDVSNWTFRVSIRCVNNSRADRPLHSRRHCDSQHRMTCDLQLATSADCDARVSATPRHFRT